MAAKVRAFCWVLMTICFAYDFYLWGGLRATPEVGRYLTKEAPYQSPLAATYMAIGSKINAGIGQTDEAREFVARKFPLLVAHPESLKYLAVVQVRRAQSWWGSFCYSVAPFLLVLSLVLHWTRLKPIRSFGTR